MFRLIFPVIFTFFLSCHAGTVLEKLAIMNGTLAGEGQYPYQVDLQWSEDGSHFCGGSIINERYILTAAHCIIDYDKAPTTLSPDDTTADYDDFNTGNLDYESLDSTTARSNFELKNLSSESSVESNDEENDNIILDPKSIRVLVGVNKRNDKNGVLYEVVKIIKHEYYADDEFTFELADIALLRLTEDIEFNDKIQPVRLASPENEEDEVSVDDPVIITGWGYTRKCMEQHEEQANDLAVARRNIYDFNKCKSEYLEHRDKESNGTDTDSVIDEGMICSKGFQYSCKGDSGGPVVNQKGVQVGVVSFSLSDLPDVYTSVRFYSEWIANNSKITEN